MSRQRYIVSYDISDDRRRRSVYKLLRGYGDHLQFSVFRCDLSDVLRTKLEGELAQAIHQDEDQVLFVDVGPVQGRGSSSISALGQPYTQPERHVRVF